MVSTRVVGAPLEAILLIVVVLNNFSNTVRTYAVNILAAH